MTDKDIEKARALLREAKSRLREMSGNAVVDALRFKRLKDSIKKLADDMKKHEKEKEPA